MYCHTRNKVAERKLISRSTCLLDMYMADRQTYPAEGYDVTRLKPGGELAHDRHFKQHHDAAGGQHQPGIFRRVSHEGLEKLRHHHQLLKRQNAEMKHQIGRGEVEVLEQTHIDDRLSYDATPR